MIQTIVLTILDQVTILDFQMEPDFDWGVFWLGNCLFYFTTHPQLYSGDDNFFSLFFGKLSNKYGNQRWWEEELYFGPSKV